MLNNIWGAMILIGIIVSLFTGRISLITNTLVQSPQETIEMILTLIGGVSLWTGIMKIAEKSGLIEMLSKKMMPILRFLFPDIPKGHKAFDYIATNMIANIFGLGWAATPAGIAAMQEMQKLNKNKSVATKSMCMFMIINMSSLQLITINILSYRTQYNSVNPAEILGPGIFATLISTVVAVIYTKIRERWY